MLVIQRPTVEAIGDDHPTRQRFAVGPLEPGFGHTIGNWLHRTLLGETYPRPQPSPGSVSITLHEFDTIAGMAEYHRHHPQHQGRRGHLSSEEEVTLRLNIHSPANITSNWRFFFLRAS